MIPATASQTAVGSNVVPNAATGASVPADAAGAGCPGVRAR